MQPEEDPAARCRSSSDAPTFPFETKGVDYRRFRHHVDPRYSVYRWDCGSYPYFKAPVTSAPCAGVQPAFASNNHGYPDHVSTAPEIFCDGRRDCYGGMAVGGRSGHDLIPQPQRCVCPDSHDPRFHPLHLAPDPLNWEPRPAGCLCCGQHVVNSHGPSNHPPRHVDSARLYPPVYRTTVGGPDVVHVYPAARELIDARQADAPVQCLSSETLSMGGSGLLDQPPEQRRGCKLVEDTSGCGQTSSSSAGHNTKDSVSAEIRDVRRSNGGAERETDDASFGSCSSVTSANENMTSDTMTDIGSQAIDEPKRSELPTGKLVDAKITPTRGSTSKVTPLYGLPSWWGDEPVPDSEQQRKYNHPTVTSSLSSSESPTQKRQSGQSDRVTIATTRASFSNINPPDTTTKGCPIEPTTGPPTTDHSQGHKYCQSNYDLVDSPTIFVNPGLHTHNSKSPPRILRNSEGPGCLGTFEMSTLRSSQENFESPNVSQSLKVISGHHSPPERDLPSTVDGELRHLQRFVYPDPLLPLPVERDFRVVTHGDNCGPLKCKAPTAFIVDLQNIDDDNTHSRITVKTSLRQFLPRRCERSLQRRLSWMKQNRKPHSATERLEGRTGSENQGDAATTDSAQRFRLSQSSSFKDSFEEAIASDVIPDDVSEAGTYTIDVSSDGESVTVADARERILATFGVTGIEDAEFDKGEWPESGKGYFEKDSDVEWSKQDESLKPRTTLRPTSLSGNDRKISGSRSDVTDPVTPTAESYAWNFSEAFTPPLLPKNDLPAQDDIVLTIYTEAASGCSITRSDTQPESHVINLHQDVRDPPRRLRSLDTAVLLAETDWSSKSRKACESWRTESTMDGGRPLLHPKTVASGCYTVTKSRDSGAEAYSPLETDKAGAVSFAASAVASESGRIVLPTDRDYFKIPASSYSGPVSSLTIGVQAGGTTDTETINPQITPRRRSTPASESGDSLESPKSTPIASGNLMSADERSRTGSRSNKKSILCDPEKDTDGTIRTGSNAFSFNVAGQYSSGNSLDVRSDLDEDGSSVDPLDGVVPAHTFAVCTTEPSVKTTGELVQALVVSQKARTLRKSVDESSKVNHPSTATESESPVKIAETSNKKPLPSSFGPKIQVTLPITDKPVASKHPKTKPPTPKSFPKSPSLPDGKLSSRRCFSDLDVAGHDESSSEVASPLVSEGKGTGGKGATSSVEHTRMNRTFALRCARREASDGTDALRSDNAQRSTRTAKKSSSSKFDDVQRSRSASRSRPGGASPRSLFESPRSAETSLNLGQRAAKKGQENDKKTRQTSSIDSSTLSRSMVRDDESSSQKSAAGFRPPNAARTAKKKNLASDRGKEGALDGASGVTIKGSPVLSRPLSSPLALPEPAANEWTRRKKYNPKQSLQTEVSVKKTGRPDGKPVLGIVDKAESRPRNRKKVAESSGKNAPSTPSDWTDDEKLQLTPRGRDLPAVCQLSAKVKLLSDQALQALRKRPEFKVNEMTLQSPKQASSDTDSLENTSPEFLYIFHNLEAAERQMSTIFKVLSTNN